MISAVSSVNFKGNEDLINAEGKYNVQPKIADAQPDSFEKKSNKTAIALGVGGLVVLGAAAALGYAVHNEKLVKVTAEELEKMDGFASKLWARTKNVGFWVGEQADKAYKWVAGLFKSEKAAEKAAEAAEGAAK